MKILNEIPSIEFISNKYKIRLVDEKIIDLEKYLKGNVVFQNEYYNKNIVGAINRCYAREQVAFKLQKILDELPDGLGLKIFDAWRPIEVQKSLYDEYYVKLKSEFPNISLKQLKLLVSKFVSIPSENANDPSVHNTGGAIDLTLIDREEKIAFISNEMSVKVFIDDELSMLRDVIIDENGIDVLFQSNHQENSNENKVDVSFFMPQLKGHSEFMVSIN